jgi:cyclase
MKRTVGMGGAVATVMVGMLAFIQVDRGQEQQDFSKVQIKVSKVSGNIYMLKGEGGNIAASVGEDGIVIVDDQYAPLADKIQTALKNLGITDKPVRFVINTHYHGDHTGGNVPFANSGSTVIARTMYANGWNPAGQPGMGVR